MAELTLITASLGEERSRRGLAHTSASTDSSRSYSSTRHAVVGHLRGREKAPPRPQGARLEVRRPSPRAERVRAAAGGDASSRRRGVEVAVLAASLGDLAELDRGGGGVLRGRGGVRGQSVAGVRRSPYLSG